MHPRPLEPSPEPTTAPPQGEPRDNARREPVRGVREPNRDEPVSAPTLLGFPTDPPRV